VIVVAREITKVFETFQRCKLAQAQAWVTEDANRLRGEFVLIVEGNAASPTDPAATERTLEILLSELPLKQAVHLTAAITDTKKNVLYERALELKELV
jgi:16S rRNA (cytidine1402-2'-O)-methyltransferase